MQGAPRGFKLDGRDPTLQRNLDGRGDTWIQEARIRRAEEGF